MKMTNAEIMKKITLLNDEKQELIQRELNNNFITFTGDADKKVAIEGNDYNYDDVTKQIEEIDKEVLALKGKLSVANATVIVDGYDLTIGQCLVKLGQLNESIDRYARLKGAKQKSSTIYNTGNISYQECLYDVKKAKEAYSKLCDEKAKLQVAIDKVNLLNEIEL